MEYSKTIFMSRMCWVITKSSKSFMCRTHIYIITWSCRMILHIKPVTISITSSNRIVCENIIWMSNPETTRSLICIKCDIVQNSEIMNMMCSNSSIVSLVNRITLNIRRHNSSNHVIMNRIATKFVGLTDIF